MLTFGHVVTAGVVGLTECYTKKGLEYKGHRNRTKGNIACQRWSSTKVSVNMVKRKPI